MSQTPIIDRPRIPAGTRVLRLSLKKQWFDLMVAGLKTTEYRKPTQWIKSRLEGRAPSPAGLYDFVLFTNGYGADKPWVLCRYEDYSIADCHHRRTYAAHVVPVERGDYKIHLGPVVQTGNLKIGVLPTIEKGKSHAV